MDDQDPSKEEWQRVEPSSSSSTRIRSWLSVSLFCCHSGKRIGLLIDEGTQQPPSFAKWPRHKCDDEAIIFITIHTSISPRGMMMMIRGRSFVITLIGLHVKCVCNLLVWHHLPSGLVYSLFIIELNLQQNHFFNLSVGQIESICDLLGFFM